MNKLEIGAAIASRLNDRRDDILQQWNDGSSRCAKHFVVDGLLPMDFAMAVYGAFPKRADGFLKLASFREKKKTAADLSGLPPILSDITYAFQLPSVVAIVNDLIGCTDVIADSTLYNGGLSMMLEGDFLNPHLDNSHDGTRKLYRWLNLLYYVSPNWSLENGGNLELWDSAVKAHETVVSHFNRLVVMQTNKLSWHSVSKVLVEEPRCCVSNYYFSAASPDGYDYSRVTSFTGRPDEPGKRVLGVADNALRNTASRLLGRGRGQRRINHATTSITDDNK